MNDNHHRSPGFKTPPHLQVMKVRMESMRPRSLHARAAGIAKVASLPRHRQVSRDSMDRPENDPMYVAQMMQMLALSRMRNTQQ